MSIVCVGQLVADIVARPVQALPSAGRTTPEAISNRHVPDSVWVSARVVHVGGAMKMLKLDLAELMDRAKSFGGLTSLDTDWDIYGNWMRLLERAGTRLGNAAGALCTTMIIHRGVASLEAARRLIEEQGR